MENSDYTLLVVDDVEENRDMLSRRLKRRGFNVLTADGGESALKIVREQPVDLVLLDIMMPDVDGLQVLRTLRETWDQAALPVIMQTAKADSDDVVEALDLGANDYVTKPIDFPIAFARVQSHLRSKVAAKNQAPASSEEPGMGDLQPGAVLAGKYRIEQKIGEGTFGSVYRARHVDLDDDVAVKVLQKNVTAGESLERFRREGVSACRIKHPNAVAVSDFGVNERGVAYLVMELLSGEALSDVVKRGPLAPRRILEVVQPVLDVLAEAHDKDIVHRDVKTENIFLHRTPRGEVVKVLDFGIAKLAGETVTKESLTAEGFVLGTPAYMAPERLLGKPYDGRSDVYSVGIMLFFLLTGRLPFVARDGDGMSLLMMHVQDEMPPLSAVVGAEVPAVLEEVVAAATTKEPEARPDARGLAERLATAVEALDDPDTPLGPPRSTMIDADAPTIVTEAVDPAAEARRKDSAAKAIAGAVADGVALDTAFEEDMAGETHPLEDVESGEKKLFGRLFEKIRGRS